MSESMGVITEILKKYGLGYGVPVILFGVAAWSWFEEKPTKVPVGFLVAASGWVLIAIILDAVKWFRNRSASAEKTPDGKFGIYVARFQNDQDNARQRDLFHQLHEAIENESELRKHIEVHDLCQPVSHGTPDDQARWLQVIGRPLNATLIIWVEETHTSKHMYRTVVHSDAKEDFTPKAERIPEEAKLSNHIKALAYTMLGMSDEAVKQLPPSSEDPQRFATHMLDVGNMLMDLPTGNRTENLNRAIEIFNNLLKVYIPEKFPRDWAGVQSNLGVAYRNLPTGDKTENLLKAIKHYEASLTVRTKKNFPADWAGTQNNLGNAYSELPTGDPADNPQKAIDAYEAALTVRTKDAFPAYWATTQNNLGSAYAQLPTGDRAQNLQKAIDYFVAALTIYTKNNFPADWAGTQNNLGEAYRQFPTGDRTQNLKKAIALYEDALTIYTKENFPPNWALIQNNLGNAYTDLPTGDRAQNLQKAIEHFEAALTVLTEAAFPHDHALPRDNLQSARDELAKFE